METLAELEDIERLLQSVGYTTQLAPLGHFSRVLLAENPYALVAAIELDSWDNLAEHVFDIQAELTQLAANAERMSIRWDLYVLIHVRTPGLKSIPMDALDAVESDTKYARKFVRVNLARDLAVLDRALRPFLPLRPAFAFRTVNPVDLLRAELLEEGVSADLVDHALRRFQATGEVTLP
jgi:hypothetical protein